MSKITVEHNPDPATLSKLGVASWPTWSKEVSKFPWTYSDKETAYVLEGQVTVTPEGGEPVSFWQGRSGRVSGRHVMHMGSQTTFKKAL